MEKNVKLSAVLTAILVFCILVLPSPVLSIEFSEEQLGVKTALEEYYFAFLGEKMEPYLATQFLAHLSEEELTEKKARIEAIWASFDSGFAIDTYQSIQVEEDVAIAEYRLTSRVKDSAGEEVRQETDYTAILFKTKEGWKVFSAAPRAQANLQVLFETVKDAQEEADISKRFEGTSPEGNETEVPATTTTAPPATGEEGQGGKENLSCDPDTSFLSNFSVSAAGYSDYAKAIIGEGKTIEISVGDFSALAKFENGQFFSVTSGAPDFEAKLEPCAYERILLGGNPKAEYDNGKIRISAKSVGDSIKLGFLNTLNFFYKLFKPEPFELWVEAESGNLSSSGRYSFIGATSRGPGELYLGDAGAKASYKFESARAGKVKIYLRVSDDGKHPDGARSAVFLLNGRTLGYEHKSRNYVYPGNFWGMEYLGEGELQKGANSLEITKPLQTSAAFTLDKILFSEKEKDFG